MDILTQLKQVYGFGSGAGYVSTHIDQVRFFWSTEPVPRAPLIYKAGLVFVLQGSKVGYLGAREFRYNPEHYLALSVPIPFDCATTATPEQPLLGLFVDLDPTQLHELVNLLPEDDQPARTATRIGVEPARFDQAMRASVDRLLHALTDPTASQALGPGLLREISFHALTGAHGPALRSLAQIDSHHQRISRAISQIRSQYAQPLRIEDLARETGMSVPVFHRAFKAITGASPHQYLKTTRLHRAKGLLLSEGLSVGEAARRVGYDNPAHFSRAFKQHFKVSPKAAQSSGYVPIDV